MNLWDSLSGMLYVRACCADPSGLLAALNKNSIPLEQLVFVDDLTIEALLSRINFARFKKIAERHGASVTDVKRMGLYWKSKMLLKRPIFVVGILLLLGLSIYLPSRVLFVQVHGNHQTPTNLVLETANFCGIKFGASRRSVRSEQVKNALLEQLPQLQWVGVNTSGCVAIVEVKEKTLQQSIKEEHNNFESIIASHDGIILESTVTRGNPLVKVGQAVKKGQVLVSGYTDCGIKISATGAAAEIYALTMRDLQVISPAAAKKRGGLIAQKTNSYIQIGKNLIKFKNNSRISDGTCVKIYNKKIIGLPGGFSLPVYLITETCYYYSLDTVEMDDPGNAYWMKDYSKRYILQRMTAGSILQESKELDIMNGIFRCTSKYTCREMIAKTQAEEIIK